MADEAGEVVVLEIGREEETGELRRIPNDKAILVGAPRHDLICRRVIHHLVRLYQKRRRTTTTSSASTSRWSSVHPFREGLLNIEYSMLKVQIGNPTQRQRKRKFRIELTTSIITRSELSVIDR